MKFVIVFSALFAVALSAAVPQDSAHAETLRYDNDNIGVEGYNFAVQTSDGKSHQEQAVLKNVGSENEALSVVGEFSYVVDGITYLVKYVADEEGFKPVGDHLPVPPQL